MKSRIFLIGFMGSGKTTLGKRIAKELNYSFADMDQLIEDTAGMSIPEIFRDHGEDIFRKWESDILLELCRKEEQVIATGGGAPCHDNMMDLMKKNGLTVYLNLPPEALKERLLHAHSVRPLIKGKNEEELLEYIRVTLEKREVFYRQADLIVDGVSPSLDAIVTALKTC